MWKEVIRQRGVSTTVEEKLSRDNLVLKEDLRRQLDTLCKVLRSMDLLRQQAIEPPRGAVLFGPPGTGKTQIARTLARVSGLAMMDLGPMDFRGGSVGQAGLKVREVFERARAQSPCIVFMDEFDSLAAARGDYSDRFTEEFVNELLSQMDSIKKTSAVFLLGATTYVERIDPAVLARLTYTV
jgi:transitional endoplasmic reticulum ATPase